MSRWPRAEIEHAFRQYQLMGLLSARSGDWSHWGNMFTENCYYVEQNLGTWAGREAVVRNMSAVMHLTGDDSLAETTEHSGVVSDPWVMCNQYPVEELYVDVERGWVWALIWNRMDDPGDGSIHQSQCFNLFHYAGGGQFSYEEDLYNPKEFVRMMDTWRPIWEAHRETAAERDTARTVAAAAAAAYAEVPADGPVPARESQPQPEPDGPGRYDRAEIDQAFWRLHDNLNRAARSTDWRILGASLTPDATFVESELGTFGKRESIVAQLADVMHSTGRRPWVRLNRFPVEAYAIDVHTGYVWSLWWARFTDPGDGSVHQARVFALLKYKGDGMFRYVETVYNPFHVTGALASWTAAHEAWTATADERLATLSARESQAQALAPLSMEDFDALDE